MLSDDLHMSRVTQYSVPHILTPPTWWTHGHLRWPDG
jgi:hypothetical protein